MKLTEREEIVLHLVEQGLPHKEIAFRQGVGVQCVKNWMVVIRKKLGITSRSVESKNIRQVRDILEALER